MQKDVSYKKTVALVNDPKKNELFYKMGVDSIVSAVNVITNVIEQQAFLDGMTTLLLSGKARISIAEVPILANAPIVGKKLWELNLPASSYYRLDYTRRRKYDSWGRYNHTCRRYAYFTLVG